jgi:SAM-dependent methyltransferase
MKGFPVDFCDCGAKAEVINGVYQFTDDAPFSIDTKGLMWLGYEQVGTNYEPWYFHNKENDVIGSSDKLAAFLGVGKVVLDIGAGLGASSISFALAGVRVIAADISQVMLESAAERAVLHGVPDEHILFARMNGYKLVLADNSVDAVLEVDMLHQVNQPELVMAEILRVLKPDGYFLQYGAWTTAPPYTEKQQAANKKYNDAQGDIQDYYNKALAEAGFNGFLFSAWEQADQCKRNFTLHTTLTDTGCYDAQNHIWTLEMGLHKTKTRATGAKQLIPEAMHNAAWNKTHAYAVKKYGVNYEKIQRAYTNRSGILAYKPDNMEIVG